MVIKESRNDDGDTMVASTVTNPDTSQPAVTCDKTVIIAQEIRFARALAGNDPKLRRKVLKNLKTWLTTRSQSTFAFSDADFLRLWKGLFYCMWMSDKPLVQEELAESVAMLVRCFDEHVEVAVQFFKAFMMTMGVEWFGIDRWRMDKFMMLVRRVTRQMLFVLHENGWEEEHVALFVKAIEATALNRDVCTFGLTNHFNDLLLEEIAKVSDGLVPKETVTQIVEPYVRYVLKNDDTSVISGIVKNIFHALLMQSDLGQMYQEKFDLWKRTNFVTGDIDSVQFNVEYKYGEDEDAEDEDGDQSDEDAEDEEVEGEEGERQNGWTEEEDGAEIGEGADEAEDDEEGDEDEDEDDDEDEGTAEKVYDPRAGRVSVEIPQIEFDVRDIIALFEKYRFKSFATSRGKKSAILLVRQLQKFEGGAYPLGIKHVPSIKPKDYAVDIDGQVQDLEDFRKDLYGEKSKNFKQLKKEKQRQRKEERLHREAKKAKKLRKSGGVDATQKEENAESLVAPTAAADSSEQPDEQDTAESKEKKASSKKRKKVPKKSPAVQKRELRMEMLRKKKEAKLLVLKDRLKQIKTVVAETAKNGSAVADSKKASAQLATPTTAIASDGQSATVKPLKQKLAEEKKVASKKPHHQPPTANGDIKPPAPTKKNDDKPFQTVDEWSVPLQDGEEEYFIPSRKLKVKQAKLAAVTPVKVAKASLKRTPPVAAESDNDLTTPARKRVKIALNKNVAQDLVEHIKQVKSSPQLPFDSSRKPSKSLLKPNLIPSPINPFYKKKIGLK